MNKPGLVTLEFLSIIVRFHNEPTRWGDFAPYGNGFVLHQIEPNVYEAKLATDIDFRPSHQKALTVKMLRLGAKRVDLWRHKAGEAPYKLSIHADGKITRSAQKPGDSEALQSI